MNFYKCHLFPYVLNANNHTYSKSLRKVIIKYFYLLPSSLKAVLRLPLQCILLKITVSYSFLETELNLVLFCFSCSSHQLFHPFIVGTSKDSNLGCMRTFSYSPSFRKWILSVALVITPVLIMLSPSSTTQCYLPFSTPVLSAYLTMYTFSLH